MSSIRILLAEHNADHQRLLKAALLRGRSEVTVVTVTNAAAMIEALEAGSVDAAVVEFDLPAGDAGYWLSRAQAIGDGCPLVVISARQSQQVVIETMRQGAADFVPKHEALRGNELARRVHAAIERHRSRREDRRRQERRVRQLATRAETDPLTGLANRYLLQRALSEGRWANDRRRYIGCAMIDADRFKQVNDRYGHRVGDQALVSIAEMIRSSVSGNDTTIRWGGEEFLVVRWTVDELEHRLWAEALRSAIESTVVTANDERLSLTVSMGIADVPAEQFGYDVIDRADLALLLAKHQGRNRVCPSAMVELQRDVEVVQATEGRVAAEHGGGSATVDAALVIERRAALIERIRSRLGRAQLGYVSRHCERVGEMSARIAGAMRGDRALILTARLAGLFHDIGKALMPEALLAKPGPLSAAEWQLISGQAEHAGWLAEELGAGEAVASCVRQLDQARGSSGVTDATPESADRLTAHQVRSDELAARTANIVAVADAMVAMLSERPCRAKRSVEQTLAVLAEEAGVRFDRAVVSAATPLVRCSRLAA